MPKNRVGFWKAFLSAQIPPWLTWILIGVFILRIPSFFEPYSYGDETIYLTLGEAIRKGIPLYSGVHDNKPPLLYIVAAIAGNLMWFKVILATWSMATIIVFWKLSNAIFASEKRGIIPSVLVFSILTTIPLLEGNIANAELFMIGLTIGGFWVLLTKVKNYLNLFFAGVLFSLASLFKVPAFFDIAAIIFLWLFQINRFDKKEAFNLIKNTFLVFVGFVTPIIISFLWFFVTGSFKEYLVAAFLQNVGYLSSWRPDAVQKSFLEKNMPLLIRFSVVFVGSLILFLKRQRLSWQFIFATLWLLFSLFGVTLSERPYPHYLVQSIAPISILVAFLFSRKNYEQVLSIIPLTIAAFVPFYYHFWHYPTISYYERFIKLISGRITSTEYVSSFGENVVGYYKVSEFLKHTTAPEDKVFVWGEGSQIYALSGRFPPGKFVADYHIRDFSSEQGLLTTLENDKPKIIVIFPRSHTPYESFIDFVEKNYGLLHKIQDTEIWKLLDFNAPPTK